MATIDVPRTALDANPNPRLCRFCNAPLRMRYPGNDPECGPARPSCGKPWCDTARDAAEQAHRYSMTDGTTLDQLHEEATHEDSLIDLYSDEAERAADAQWDSLHGRPDSDCKYVGTAPAPCRLCDRLKEDHVS